jgi:hypothetical protein
MPSRQSRRFPVFSSSVTALRPFKRHFCEVPACPGASGKKQIQCSEKGKLSPEKNMPMIGCGSKHAAKGRD